MPSPHEICEALAALRRASPRGVPEYKALGARGAAAQGGGDGSLRTLAAKAPLGHPTFQTPALVHVPGIPYPFLGLDLLPGAR
jgi:hypothetical protein